MSPTSYQAALPRHIKYIIVKKGFEFPINKYNFEYKYILKLINIISVLEFFLKLV